MSCASLVTRRTVGDSHSGLRGSTAFWMTSVHRISSLRIPNESSLLRRTRSREFSMAKPVASYLPPAGPLNATLIIWECGPARHRGHGHADLGGQFTPN